MNTRTKRQHTVPRFYLQNFCDEEGYIWTHDSRRGEARRTLPENTGFQTNIYSPDIEDGKRYDKIEEDLSKIESTAAPIITELLNCRQIGHQEKAECAVFIASMFVRSPAQIRQFAAFAGDVASWMGAHHAEREMKEKRKRGENSETEEQILEMLTKPDMLTMNVDRRIGLLGFTKLPQLAQIIACMNWSFEVSEREELITSDNPVFWVPATELPDSPYGFGLSHPAAVMPFPLSPNVILRMDHEDEKYAWSTVKIISEKARQANRLQAKHKDHCLFYRTDNKSLHELGMEYAEPVQQLDSGVKGPAVTVRRSLSP